MLQNDIPDTNRDEKLQRLYFELEQAREDQRVSLDHIVQALVACIAALAILYSVASGFGSSGQNDIPFKNEGIAFIAACIILVAGFIARASVSSACFAITIWKRLSAILLC